MNRIMISGFVASDPVSRYTGNGNLVVYLQLAVRKAKKSDGTGWTSNYFDVDAWGKSAEYAKEYIQKGDYIYMEGHLNNDVFEQEGKRHTRTKIVAERFEYAPRQKEDTIEELLSVPSEAEQPTPKVEEEKKEATQENLQAAVQDNTEMGAQEEESEVPADESSKKEVWEVYEGEEDDDFVIVPDTRPQPVKTPQGVPDEEIPF